MSGLVHVANIIGLVLLVVLCIGLAVLCLVNMFRFNQDNALAVLCLGLAAYFLALKLVGA